MAPRWMVDVYRLMLANKCTLKMDEICIYREAGNDHPNAWRASINVNPEGKNEWITWKPTNGIPRHFYTRLERMSLATFLGLKGDKGQIIWRKKKFQRDEKEITAHCALGRFYLYPIVNEDDMWCLYDYENQTQHFVLKENADSKVRRILLGIEDVE